MNHITRRTVFQGGGMLGAVLALDAVSPALAGTTPAATSVRFKAIDAALRGGVSNNDVAGVVAMAATPKGVVYEGAFGKANVATGAPMTVNTVFWLLSMTKAFTATACMQLIEQGRLHLDDDAAKYLPELISPQDLRCDLHSHTTASDGTGSTASASSPCATSAASDTSPSASPTSTARSACWLPAPTCASSPRTASCYGP